MIATGHIPFNVTHFGYDVSTWRQQDATDEETAAKVHKYGRQFRNHVMYKWQESHHPATVVWIKSKRGDIFNDAMPGKQYKPW